MRNKEKSFYEPFRDFLRNKFVEKFGNCHLEITYDGKFSEDLKKHFADDVLFFHKQHLYPDLTGFVVKNSSRYFITVEIKSSPIKIQDICKPRLYAEFFGAKYSLLICSKPIPEEIKRILRQRPQLQSGYGYTPIILGYLREEDSGTIIDLDWFPDQFAETY